MIFAAYLFLIALSFLHPIEAFAPGLAVYRPVLVLSLLVLAFAAISAIGSGRMAARPRHLILLGCFAAIIAFSRIANGWTGGAIDALIDFGATAVLFLVTIFAVTSIRRLKVTCALIALCMTMLAVAGIAAFHTGFMKDSLLVHETVDAEDDLAVTAPDVIPSEDTSGLTLWRVRSWGFLSDPNDFAQAMIVALPLLAGIWTRRRRLRNMLCVWLPGGFLLYAIYLTHSRGALLGLAAVLLFSLLRRAGVMRTGMLVAALGIAAVFVGFTGGRSYSSGGESAGGRIEAWSEGMDMMRSNPLFGVGYGNFTDNFPLTAHNSFVLCFSELGLTGYFVWLSMLVLAFKETKVSATMAQAESDEARWARLLRLSLIGFLVCAWFLSRTYQPVLFILLALCTASWHCAQPVVEPESARELVPLHWPATTVKLMLASIVVIYFIVRFQNAFVR
ncbi:MAG: O-antigen ligase family protein [Rhodanobacteraceae bacterium]